MNHTNDDAVRAIAAAARYGWFPRAITNHVGYYGVCMYIQTLNYDLHETYPNNDRTKASTLQNLCIKMRSPEPSKM